MALPLKLIIIGILAAIILAALLWALQRYRNATRPGGSNPPPPLPSWHRTLQDALERLKSMETSEGSIEEDCAEIRALVQRARDQGCPEILLKGFDEHLDELCG